MEIISNSYLSLYIEKINSELFKYNEKLIERPQIIAANKMDLPSAQENLDKIKSIYEAKGIKVCPISAATNTGLDELLSETAKILENNKDTLIFEENYEEYQGVKRSYLSA